MADPVTTAETVSGLIGYKLWGLAEFILKYQLMHIVVGVFSANYATAAARRSLEKGKQSKYRTPCNGTEYISLGDNFINPETGNEYVLQRIRKESNTVDLREVFDPSYRKQVMAYLDKAAQLCTEKRPYVMDKLEYVVPSDQYDTVIEQISRDVFNHFGPNNGVRQGVSGNDYYEETEVYHLLVFEPTAHKKQYRFVTIDESMIWHPEEVCGDALPQIEDMVIESEGGLVLASEHYQKDRLETNRALIRGIKADIDGIYSMFKVGEKTGRVLDVNDKPLYKSNVVQFPTRDAA